MDDETGLNGVPEPGDPDPGEAARLLAPSLVGLSEDDASRLVEEAGLDPQVVPPGVTAVTMEFRANRIRLFLDDAGLVARAVAG